MSCVLAVVQLIHYAPRLNPLSSPKCKSRFYFDFSLTRLQASHQEGELCSEAAQQRARHTTTSCSAQVGKLTDIPCSVIYLYISPHPVSPHHIVDVTHTAGGHQHRHQKKKELNKHTHLNATVGDQVAGMFASLSSEVRVKSEVYAKV